MPLDPDDLPDECPDELRRDWETVLSFRYVAAPAELWSAVRDWLVRRYGSDQD